MKKTQIRSTLKMGVSILVGNALLAFAVCAFVIPNDIMLGGSNGIALFIQVFIPVRLSIISACVNGALFFLGWAFLGWKFAATSLASTILYPSILACFETLPLGTLFHENILVSAIFCAVLFGIGIGMVVRAGGSTGGMDIPPCILYQYKGIPVGKSLMFFDSLVVLMQVLVKGMDGILCSILVVVIMSYTVDRAMVSGEKKVQITIISPEYERIRQKILHEINCGVTMLDIETGYEGKVQKAILSVVYAKSYPLIREMALGIDKNAFIIASDVMNVHGVGYTISRPEVK